MEKKKYIYIYVIIIISCIGSFFLGTYFSKINTNGAKNIPTSLDKPTRGNGAFGQKGSDLRGGMQGKLINGDVLSSDGNMVTIKTRDGGSKIIFVSENTKIDKNIIAKTSDISVGSNLTITGEANQDGSVTASSVQIK